MWAQARGKQPLFRSLGLTPADFSLTMAHCAWGGTGNPLQLIGWNHHHRHLLVATSSTEIGGQISRHGQICFVGKSVGAFQHHMTSWTFLGMEPKVTASGLAKRNPVVLAMVSPHLNREPSRGDQFQRTGLILSTLQSRVATALLGLQQLFELLPQLIQGGESCLVVLPFRAQLILDKRFALSDQLKTLLMVLKPLLEDRA